MVGKKEILNKETCADNIRQMHSFSSKGNIFMRSDDTYDGFGSGGLSEPGLELRVSGIGGLHNPIANDSRNHTAYGSEREEEGSRISRLPH